MNPLQRALFVGLWLCTATVVAADDGVFVDTKRSHRKQRDAAEEAQRNLAAENAHKRFDQLLSLLEDPSGAVRDAAVETIIKKWDDEQLAVLRGPLLRKVGRKQPDLAGEAAAEIFGRRKYAAAVPWLVDALNPKLPEYRRRLSAWALGEIAESQALEDIERRYDKERSPLVKAQLLETLSILDPSNSNRIDTALAASDAQPVAIVALEILALMDEERALDAIGSLFANKSLEAPEHAPLFFTALDILSTMKNADQHVEALRNIVDGLVGRLVEFEGRPRYDTLEVLQQLTHEDLGHDIELWENWWKAQRGEWSPPGSKRKGVAGHTGVVEYHGISVDSKQIVFISDVSGGMGRNTDGKFDGDGPTRLDLARTELERVLENLDKSVFANLVYFGSFFYQAADRPLPLKKARKKLLSYNRKQQIPEKRHHNRGNVYDTLVHVIEQGGVDTIYLLTEGAPTEGKYQRFERFLFHFRFANRCRKTRIHLIGVGDPRGRNKDFLESLSGESGGLFKTLKFQ